MLLRRDRLASLLVLCWLLASPLHGGMRGVRAYLTLNEVESHVFAMVPGKNQPIREARGICYELKDDGSMEPIWKTSGWWADDVVLSTDGRSLMRIGGWHSFDQDAEENVPVEDTLAVALYRDGKLLRQYAIKEVVGDLGKLEETSAGVLWIEGDPKIVGRWGPYGVEQRAGLEEGESFRVETVDGVIRFSRLSGAVLD